MFAVGASAPAVRKRVSMTISPIIRFVLAAMFATLACIGLFFGIPGLPALWTLAWLLLMGRSELTKPIPREELWPGLLVTGILLAALITFPFLHLSRLPEPHGAVRLALAGAIWVGWMFAIYCRWQKQRGEV